MSKLRCEVTKIVSISEHSNAERLELATVFGWNVCVQKGTYKENDLVIYIPIDSILPIELETKIFGEDSKVKLSKGRIRSIRLRGEISQGMIIPIDYVDKKYHKDGTDVADVLGITKYEPPVSMSPQSKCQQVSKKQVNPNFRKYTDIDNFKNYPNVFDENDMIVATEKVHGCLHADTKLTLFDGSTMKIRDIVDNNLNVDLLGIDETGKFVKTKIKNWYNNGKTRNWLDIQTANTSNSRGNNFRRVRCTANHQIFNNDTNTYINAENLKIGNTLTLYSYEKYPTDIQIQILNGIMLGDGSFSDKSKSITFSHKIDHESYLHYIQECLGELSGNQQMSQTSGYGTKMVRSRTISNIFIDDLYKSWKIDGKCQVPKNMKLTPITLAFWYMDDGSLSHHESQNDRACFATCGFNEKSVDTLILAFNDIGIIATKYNTEGYWRIRLNTKEAYKLFDMISPYIPNVMRYKLPKEYNRTIDIDMSIFNNPCEYKYKREISKILNIYNSKIRQINTTRYDIETETHNFFANGVLVHNSNTRFGWVPTKDSTLWKKFLKLVGLLPKYEFVVGSHNVQLQDKSKNSKTFYTSIKTNIYWEAAIKYNLKNILKPGEVVYGEIYGDGIQKGYTYGCKAGERKVVFFDLMVDGKYINYLEFKAFCSINNLPQVPELYIGKFNAELVKKLTIGDSILEPTQKVREGVVIKTLEETSCRIGRKMLKYVSDEYLLGKNSDNH